MKTALQWKAYYEEERRALGERGLARLVEEAPEIALAGGGALVFPHARLAECGALVAAAASAVVASGRDEVLAIGVLHGGRGRDADLVRRARAGDGTARERLRRVHGPGIPGDEGLWEEEFSLDGFRALLGIAAEAAGARPPRVLERYPFLAGDDPESLPGMEELRAALSRGAALVATADHVHHGAGYGTAPAERIPLRAPAAERFARDSVARSLALLASGDFAGFLRHAEDVRSDFRDAGPVLAALLGTPFPHRIESLVLVDYAEALGAEAPTWVAAALVSGG